MSSHAKFSRRLSLFAVLLVGMVVAFGWRLVDFQIVRASEIQAESFESRSVTRTLTALRGEILDR